MSEKGWIYIASNPAMVGYLKIGMTQKTPELRLAELQTTGVPEPFKLEYSCLVAHALAVETAIHRHFDNYRSNANREFFNLAVAEVVEHIHESFVVLRDG